MNGIVAIFCSSWNILGIFQYFLSFSYYFDVFLTVFHDIFELIITYFYIKITNMKTIKDLIKPVQKTSALTDTLCAGHSTSLFQKSEMLHSIISDHTLSIQEKIIIEILIRSGCRISEALSVDSSDITIDGLVFIRGLKGSSNRYVQLISTTQWITIAKSNKGLICGSTNRWRIYRIFESKGFSWLYSGNKKKSVTHLPRHLHAVEILNITKDRSEASKALGHKSSKNLKYYDKQK